MVVGLLGAPDIVPLHLHFGRKFVEAVEEGNLIRRAQRPALGTGAVVAIDEDDQRVLRLCYVDVCVRDCVWVYWSQAFVYAD